MFGRRFRIFSAFGIPIQIDLSWFVVAILVAWSLAENAFPTSAPGRTPGAYWVMGTLGALGLFASVVLHELGHAVVAKRYGLRIRGITLFIFGGVAELEDESPSPQAEFMVAIAGPLVSVAIAVACFGLAGVTIAGGLGAGAAAVLSLLASLNLVLVIFNMIPAFPLDGGRVLRSILWYWKKDLRWATRVTSWIGSGFGMVLIGIGILRFVFERDLFGGMWMALIGMFLRNAAQMSYRHVLMRRALEGEPVSRFMHVDPIAVPRALSVRDLVENFVYRYHFKMFPVIDNGRLLGCVTTRSVQELPRAEWERQSVGALLEPCSEENTIAPGADAMEALERMSQSGASRLMVVEGDRLLGIIALKDLLKFLALKVELEGAGS